MSRILFLRYEEELIIDSLATAFKQLGYQVETLVLSPLDCHFETAKQKIDKFQPDACITHNFYVFDLFENERTLEYYLAEKQIPCIAWFWDSPIGSGYGPTVRRFLFESISSNILNLTIDTGHLQFLRQRGIRADYLPLAIADRFKEASDQMAAQNSSQLSYDISFVGKPMNFSDQEPFKTESDMKIFYKTILLEEILGGLKFNFPSEEQVRRARESVGRCFKECVDHFFSENYENLSSYARAQAGFLERIRSTLGDYMVDYFRPFFGRVDFLYSWFQLNVYLHRLSEFNLGVFGGEDWGRGLLPNCISSSRRLTWLELVELFRFSKISFSLTKWHFQNAVHERVFIAYGCGGFPLTDYRKDLDTVFEPDEVVVFHNFEEARDKIRFYLKHENERKKVAERGRARVLRDHTYSRRAEDLARLLHSHFGVSIPA